MSWPIFLPDEWSKELGTLNTEDYEINDDELKAHALEISGLRTEILEKALAIDAPNVNAA